MKYCGGTFSGHNTILCAEKITVVGHKCTVDGRVPETERIEVIERMEAPTDIRGVRHFLEVIGIARMLRILLRWQNLYTVLPEKENPLIGDLNKRKQ